MVKLLPGLSCSVHLRCEVWTRRVLKTCSMVPALLLHHLSVGYTSLEVRGKDDIIDSIHYFFLFTLLLMLWVKNWFTPFHTGGISTARKSTHIPHCTGIMILSWIWLFLWRVSKRNIKKNLPKPPKNLHQTNKAFSNLKCCSRQGRICRSSKFVHLLTS